MTVVGENGILVRRESIKSAFAMRRLRILFRSAACLSLLIAVTSLLGCSRPGPNSSQAATLSVDVAPGILLIDVLEGGRPEHYWQYELQPATGTIRTVQQMTFADYTHEDIPRTFQKPAGAIGACEQKPTRVAPSPDGAFQAHCTTSNYADALEIYSSGAGGGRVAEWKIKERGIRGFAWSANSQSIAILNVTSYSGKTPLELLSALSGHPVPHDKVLLDIFELRTGHVTEYVIRDNVVSSFTRILNWSQ
jgi:hypothetical protein